MKHRDQLRRRGIKKQLIFATFGKSFQGRDLPLLIADKEGLHDPRDIHSKGRVLTCIGFIVKLHALIAGKEFILSGKYLIVRY